MVNRAICQHYKHHASTLHVSFKAIFRCIQTCQLCVHPLPSLRGSIEAHMRSPVSDPIRSLSEPCN
ncbi:unnamed protein product [Brassica rapa]|uniref:Uncharacterized protein n=2 Tax=Brassica TaxID=3705 RepID=A0A8D9HK13_BRACM|nr:unnamed protein product [Brassica napus]CAG7900869.1 unnamed protein product [Brassica rapa]